MAKYQDTVETLITARNEVAAELQRAEQQMRAQAQRERQRAMEQERFAQERARVEEEIRDQSLRSQGRHLEADLTQVRRSYDARIQAARRAGQRELADRLETLKKLREAEAQAAEERRRIREREEQGTRARIGRTLQFAQGAIALEALGRAAAAMTQKLVEARNEGHGFGETVAGMTESLAMSIPVASGFFQLGQNIREMFTGERAELERLNQEMERQNKLFAERGAILRQSDQARRQAVEGQRSIGREMELLQNLDPAIQQRIQLRHQAEREMADVQRRLAEQRERDEASGALDAARSRGRTKTEAVRELEAEAEALERVIRFRAGALEARQREAREQAAAQRQRAAEAAETEIEQLRLRQTGRMLEAELLAIRTAADARVRAAEEAGNKELAAHERTLQAMREREVREHERRRQQLEELEGQRQAMAEEARTLSDQINRARSRSGTAALPTADQDRFLTGVREVTQQQDRAMQAALDKQLRVAEQQLSALQQAQKDIQETVRLLRDAPILRMEIAAGGGGF